MKSPRSSRDRSPFRSKRAFTIVEVAVAGGVMLLALASSILVLQSGFRALDTARNTTLAAQIIQSEIEYVRMLSLSGVRGLPASSTIDLSSIFPNETAAEKQVLTQMSKTFTVRTLTVTPLTSYVSENDGQTAMYAITITVSWKGLDGVTRTRSSTTRYAENGLYAYYYTHG